MNWRIFLLTSELTSDVPYEKMVGSLRARSMAGRRFKFGKATSQRASFYYGNVGSSNEGMGYRPLFLNEVAITKSLTSADKVLINFRVPNRRLVGLALLGLFIIFFSLRIMPEIGFKGATIAIALIYFGLVIELNSQLYYFKDELDSIESSYRKSVKDS